MPGDVSANNTGAYRDSNGNINFEATTNTGGNVYSLVLYLVLKSIRTELGMVRASHMSQQIGLLVKLWAETSIR